MTAETFLQILRQIVIDFPHSDTRQLNSMALVYDWPDLRTPSWGKTYADYLAGHFYSRSWENAGADPDTISGQFPALFIEPGDVIVNSARLNNSKYKTNLFTLLFVAQKDCEGCQIRSAETVRQNLLQMIQAFFEELQTYSLVTIDSIDMWLSSGRLQYLIDEGATVDNYGETIQSYLEPADYQVKNWLGMPDLVGAYVELELETCEETEIQFTYDHPIIDNLAVVRCKNC